MQDRDIVIYCGTLIGTRMCSVDRCYFRWPWVRSWVTLTTPKVSYFFPLSPFSPGRFLGTAEPLLSSHKPFHLTNRQTTTQFWIFVLMILLSAFVAFHYYIDKFLAVLLYCPLWQLATCACVYFPKKRYCQMQLLAQLSATMQWRL